jgi:hypothetical protein
MQYNLSMNCKRLNRLDPFSCTSLTLKSVFKQTCEDAIDDAITEITIGVLVFKISEYVGSLFKTKLKKKKKKKKRTLYN